MSQPKRLGALNKFKAGERSILVCVGFGTNAQLSRYPHCERAEPRGSAPLRPYFPWDLGCRAPPLAC